MLLRVARHKGHTLRPRGATRGPHGGIGCSLMALEGQAGL